MSLKAVHDSLEEIPEQYRELYTEKDGKFELTGIQGIRTQADVERVQEGLRKQREDNSELRKQIKTWQDLGEMDEVQKRLDRYPELEAAAKGKLDEEEIESIVEKRVEGTIKSRLAPIERDNKRARDELAQTMEELQSLRGEKRQRTIHDSVRKAMTEEKIQPEYQEDVLLWAERVMDISDDGQVVTKDGVGVTPGMDPSGWLQEMLPKRPGWIQPSKGGGARGSGPSAGFSGSNPWAPENWNMTKQGQVVREKGIETAQKMAEAAGSKVGASRPPQKK